jgi:Phytanoyl-CoA dioxygenase (PhyH)
MSVDVRTRLFKDVRALTRDEVLDTLIPDAIAVHGDLAARGVEYLDLPSLGVECDGRGISLGTSSGSLTMRSGVESAGVVAVLSDDALSELVQDVQSAMGLAMTSRVKITAGNINDWISWEPVLRALLDGRKVHEAGDVTFVDLRGDELDLGQAFGVDDDVETVSHFLAQAGFLHLRAVFDQSEMSALAEDVDEWISRARPDDGESWWATDDNGLEQAVRVLFFNEKSPVLRVLLDDDRFRWIGGLTDDGHQPGGGAEGLVKPLGIVRGLSDLPWHKDCGQGRHSYSCNSLTCGISVTGADRTSGALGVIPGSHRANTMAAGRDSRLDLQPRMLETLAGDVTVHLSDTLHRAHPPVDRPRKVVYSGFTLPPLPGDVTPPGRQDPEATRAARAALSDAQSRIEAADNESSPQRYRAGHGR